MKAKMKWLSVVLTLCLILSGILVVASAASDTTRSSEATNGGIQALLVTSKNVYSAEETIDATVSIGNISGVDVANVKTSITSPMEPAQENGSLDKTCEKLGAAQLLQNSFDLVLGDLGDNPYSGMDIQFVVALVAMVVSAAGLAILLITGKIRMNKTFCLLLLVGAMLIGLIPSVRAAETEEKKVEVAKLIKVGDRLINLTATVTWEEVETPVITRADMEAAIQEILWDYYMKDVWVQYDSVSLDKMSTLYGGFGRLDNHLSTLEDANSHDNLYSVCSNYPWVAYYETLGFPLFGNCLNAQSHNIWAFSDTTVENDRVNDMTIVRWHGYVNSCEEYDASSEYSARETGYLFHDNCVQTIDELKDFFRNWSNNLRPGDIIYLPGHIAVYAGNGYILHCGGGKYEAATGKDDIEINGSISAWTVEDFFFSENSYYSFSSYKKRGEGPTRVSVVRPLNILTIPNGNDDLGDDPLDDDFEYNGVNRLHWEFGFEKVKTEHNGYTIQPSAYTRMQYPGMNIDRTVNITPYGTATKDEEITYTVAIYNESNNAKYMAANGSVGEKYSGLPVTETLPENVKLVSAEGNPTIIGDTLYWSVDVDAGDHVELSYTVKVTGEIGDEIVNGGGWVGSIPSNTIVNTIGGQKLSAEAIVKMNGFNEADEDALNLNDTEFAEYIYNVKAGLDLNIPDVQELLDMLFTQEKIGPYPGMFGLFGGTNQLWMYTLNDTTANSSNQIWRNMVVDGFFGGTWVWSNSYDPDVRRTDDPRVDYLEPGDIIVNMTLSSSNGLTQQARTVTAWQVLVYMGDGYFASLNSDGLMTRINESVSILSCLNYDVFVALRPSQVYPNINE